MTAVGVKKKVLFVCYGNMIRSQMAEGLARDLAGALLDVYSAGLRPIGVVSEEAVSVMEEKGIDITGQFSKGLGDVPLDDMDYVVSLSNRPAKSFLPPEFAGEALDWVTEDPLGQPIEFYRKTRDELESRVKKFVEELWQSP